jgi:hypothetical protein
MRKIIENIGWWGIPPTGDDIKSFSGTIVYPKRKVATPEVGDTIIDKVNGKNIGFTINEVGTGDGMPTDDYYLRVTCDGYTYEDDRS